MAILLIKGGNISLTKTDPSLKNIIVGLGWDVRETDSESFDLDTSILMIQSDGKARSDRDFIYYHQKDSACGAVHHTGDNRTGAGDGDDESIHVFLDKVPAEIQKLIVCVSIYEADKKKQNFGQVLSAFIRLVNKDTQQEVTRYDLSENASMHTAMIFGEIYRYDGEWKFKAVGQGFQGGLAELVRLHGINA
ncbi:TerD family protein [Methylobacter tundripaludum]|jgi:tellurium resistance protein TerD|uniref:TerD family protein n=1 Tax=Methylobacter tundripaludum TaxID=173365 RepID=UPI0004DF7CE6|nr:TerD family protein [Methylobacter tundripaludum]